MVAGGPCARVPPTRQSPVSTTAAAAPQVLPLCSRVLQTNTATGTQSAWARKRFTELCADLGTRVEVGRAGMRIPLMRRPAPLEPELADLKGPGGGRKPAARAEAEVSETTQGWGEWARQLARQVLTGGTVSRADGAYRDLGALSASGEGVSPAAMRRGRGYG